MSRKRRNKQLSEEELLEIQEFVYRKNEEEDKFLHSMTVNYKCKNKNQAKVRESIRNKEISIVSGLPGTGKTYIACAEALKLIKSKPKYKKILLVKSVTQLKGEDLGFLPGDLKDKLDPYMISFIDNFEKLIGETMTRKLRELGLINIQPLAFIRGRSIDNTIIIVDEAQNISVENMRTLMTRIGDNSKMVILGDVKQKDIKNKKDSSLEVIIERFKDVEGFGCVELRNPDDVVRNPIIKIIESTFDDIENEKILPKK
jgi:phosphate starvation-inducible PhoH-like protein